MQIRSMFTMRREQVRGMTSLTERMVRHVNMGVPRDTVVMAAAMRSGKRPEDIEQLLSAAEADPLPFGVW